MLKILFTFSKFSLTYICTNTCARSQYLRYYGVFCKRCCFVEQKFRHFDNSDSKIQPLITLSSFNGMGDQLLIINC